MVSNRGPKFIKRYDFLLFAKSQIEKVRITSFTEFSHCLNNTIFLKTIRSSAN